jgi:hypothetical protein
MKKFLSIVITGLILNQGNAQILAEELKIGCGNNYFWVFDDSQAMVVNGKWCGDSYLWTAMGIGVSYTEDAYLDDQLFTGVCADLDSIGNVLAKYTFEKGKLSAIQQFDKDGSIGLEGHFLNGVPHGEHILYSKNGEIDSKYNFTNGVLDGEFYTIIHTDPDPETGLSILIEEGTYVNGQKIVRSSNWE